MVLVRLFWVWFRVASKLLFFTEVIWATGLGCLKSLITYNEIIHYIHTRLIKF